MKLTFSYLLVLKYFLAYLGSSVKTTNIQQVIITGKYLFSLKVTQRNVKYIWQKCNYQFGIGQFPGDRFVWFAQFSDPRQISFLKRSEQNSFN